MAASRAGGCDAGLRVKGIGRPSGRDTACCVAQMFLGSGDGLVFRGAVGPWYSETRDAFHLDQDQAAKLMEMIVHSYKRTSTPRRRPSSSFMDAAPNPAFMAGVGRAIQKGNP